MMDFGRDYLPIPLADNFGNPEEKKIGIVAENMHVRLNRALIQYN